MLNVTCKPFMLCAIMLNVIMLIVTHYAECHYA
jgi:hypothetical protein